jgi:Xaa-Pro aminopeptidase
VSSSTFPYSAAELDRFRQVQRLAYDIAQEVESQLRVGMTEADACVLVEETEAGHGVGQVFHLPYVWFGSRTIPATGWSRGQGRARGEPGDGGRPWPFAPTDIELADGMPVIVDLGPVVDGIPADVGYSCVLGANPMFADLDRALPRIRTFLLEGVRAGATLGSLYRELDVLLAQRGWQSCHETYPDRALGHLVFPLGDDPDRPTPLAGFGTAAAEGLLAAGAAALDGGTAYPVWNDTSFSDLPASPGLWAVEPHIGRDGVGVKFEELLVVTEDDAFWLDDHLPHAQRWAAAGYSIEALRRL